MQPAGRLRGADGGGEAGRAGRHHHAGPHRDHDANDDDRGFG